MEYTNELDGDLSDESLLEEILNANGENETANQARNVKGTFGLYITENDDSVQETTENNEESERGSNFCGGENFEPQSNIENEVDESLLIDISTEQNGRLMKQIIRPGDGIECPSFGDHVNVHYTGYVIQRMGKQLNVQRVLENADLHFILGEGMFKGVELGILTMHKGEVAILRLHHEYAYGTYQTSPPVSMSTPIYVKLELVGFEMADFSPLKDKTILRKIIHRGIGQPLNICANDGWQVKVNLVGIYKSKTFECGEKIFALGEGSILNIPEGIELAIMHFRLQEKSILYLKCPYAYRNDSEEYGIPADADVAFEVTLLDAQKDKELWEMNSDEKLEKAKICREKGIAFVEAGLYKKALKQFKWILLCLENEPGVTSESEERKAVLIKGYLNMSLCYLKLGLHNEAIRVCSKALCMDPKNEKALYRRGQAKMGKNDWYEAIEDFNKLCCLSPGNQIGERSIKECQTKIREQVMKDKSIFCNMFQKFVNQDEARKRGLRTETGVWQTINQPNEDAHAKRDRRKVPMNYNQRLYEQHNAVLRDVNIIELSNNAHL